MWHCLGGSGMVARTWSRIVSFVILLLIAALSSPTSLHEKSKVRVSRLTSSHPRATASSLTSMPLSFEPNYGQFDPAVRFESRASGFRIFLTDHETVLGLSNQVSNKAVRPNIAAREIGKHTSELQSQFHLVCR